MALATRSHPVYPIIEGNALYMRCVCGGVLKFHGIEGCDDCPCEGFRPQNGMRRIEPSARVPALIAQLSPMIDELLELHGGPASWVRLCIAKDTGECITCGGTIDATCMCSTSVAEPVAS